jgi:tetratricopeptide (TPR) repeat protein
MFSTKPQIPKIDELKASADIDGLKAALAFANEPQIRQQAIEALYEIGSIEARAIIRNALKRSYYYDVRRNAAAVLKEKCTKEEIETLVGALKDPIEEVRFSAAISLGKLGDNRAKETLNAAKNAQDQEISNLAIQTLKNLDQPTVKALNNKPTQVQKTKNDNSTDKINDKKLANELTSKADQLDNKGSHKEALTFYDKALKANPKDLDILFNKGLTLIKIREHEKALICFEKILRSNDQDFCAWYNKATCEDELQLKNEAIKSYSQFLRCTPHKTSQDAKFAEKRLKQLS